MQIYVNVTFLDRLDLLSQLVQAFFGKDFNPESTFMYDGKGTIQMLINFDSCPSENLMNIVSQGHINTLGYNVAEIDDRWFDTWLGRAENELLLWKSGHGEKLEAENLQFSSTPDGGAECSDKPGDGKVPDDGKEANIPTRFIESADALNLPERTKMVYLQMLKVAATIDGRITWEDIEKTGLKVSQYDKKTIAKAVREVYGFNRIMSFVKKLATDESVKAINDGTGSDGSSSGGPSGDEPSSGEEQKVFAFTSLRVDGKEFDAASLQTYEEELNAITKDKPLKDRVKEVFDTLNAQNAEAGQDLVETALQLPSILLNATILEEKYGKAMLMRKRINVLKLFKEKFSKLGVPADDVTLKGILCDLRNMIMTEEEIRALTD